MIKLDRILHKLGMNQINKLFYNCMDHISCYFSLTKKKSCYFLKDFMWSYLNSNLNQNISQKTKKKPPK